MRDDRKHRFVGARTIRARSFPQPLTRPPATLQAPSVPPAPTIPKQNAQMRFRADGWHYAEKNANFTDAELTEQGYDIAAVRAVPIPEPGDVWRIYWHKSDESAPDVLAGYAICCPRCKGVHCWTMASNCQFQIVEHTYTDDAGVEHKYKVCGHSGSGSCWQWSGSAEANTLTAHPSLLNHGCGWHGFLTDGSLREC